MKLRAVIMMLAAVGAPASSWAMPQASTSTGSIIRSPQAANIPDGPNDNVAGLKVLRAFGECVAKDRSLATKLLAALPGSKQEYSTVEWISKSECLSGGTLRFQATLLRGVVAEYLLSRMDIATPTDWARLSVFPDSDAKSQSQDNPTQREEVALIDFGQCVATKDMASVKALMATRPNSAAESAAFAQIAPTLGNCAEKGVSLKLNRFQLRGYLAEGAYRAMVTQSKEIGRAQG